MEIDRKTAIRIFDPIEAIMRNPFSGIGKPEPLKYLGMGVWSRRITQEHRLVYLVTPDRIDFLQARYHY
jgi:toxin YoeB